MIANLMRLVPGRAPGPAFSVLGYLTLSCVLSRFHCLRASRLGRSSFGLRLLTSLNVFKSVDPDEGEILNESIPARRRHWQRLDGEHAYLEEVEGKEAVEFIKRQNDEAIKQLGGDPEKTDLYKTILAILESKDKIPYVSKVGEFLYNFWDDDKSPRGILRRCTVEDYKNASPSWETLLDFAELGKAEGESWVYKSYSVYKPVDPKEAPRRILLFLSRGGGDAVVVREFDLVDRAFVPEKEAFYIAESKNWVRWLDQDTLFVGTDFKDGKSMTNSGYPRTTRLWRRGTNLLTDSQAYFEGQQGDIGVSCQVSRHGQYRYQIRHRSITFYTNEEWVLLPGYDCDAATSWIKVPKQDDATFSIFQDQALIELRSDWTVPDGTVYPSGSMISAPLEEFLRLGPAAPFTSIFRPTERNSLYAQAYTENYLVITELEDVKTRVTIWRLSRNDLANQPPEWIKAGAEPAAVIGGIYISAVDADSSDSVWVTTSSFTVPSQLALVALTECIGKGPGPDLSSLRKAAPLKALPKQFNSDGMVEKQFMAKSRDGTSVPYFLVCKESILSAGDAPCLLYGYGGFEISMTPSYASVTGRKWLEDGGCYVVANIRGGGEYGPRWHKAALRENRELAYDDFIAVAEDLISRGFTSPARLGIRGGSNGGLLMGNMLTRRPDLFGAVVCQVPLLDMRRYHKLLAGASWTAEYGEPDTSDWRYLQCVSAYHNIDPDSIDHYPPLLMLTSMRDDRVHPYHARALVRRLLDVKESSEARGRKAGRDGKAAKALAAKSGRGQVLYYENMEGGHGGAADLRQQAFQTALYISFLKEKLGM